MDKITCRFISRGSNKLLDTVIGRSEFRVLVFPGFPGANENMPLLGFLADQGMECHSVSYRGIRSSSGTFSFLGSFQDALLAMELINPAVVIGYSYGAVYAWHACRKFFPRLLCLLEPFVDIACIWKHYTQKNPQYMKQLMKESLGIAKGNWRVWMSQQKAMDAYSPSKTTAPRCQTICIYGTKDTEIPSEVVWHFCRSKNIQLYTILKCDHYLTGFHTEIGRIILLKFRDTA